LYTGKGERGREAGHQLPEKGPIERLRKKRGERKPAPDGEDQKGEIVAAQKGSSESQHSRKKKKGGEHMSGRGGGRISRAGNQKGNCFPRSKFGPRVYGTLGGGAQARSNLKGSFT